MPPSCPTRLSADLGRYIDFVGGHVEIGNLVAGAGGTGAVTVELGGVAEHVGTRTAGEFVHASAAHQNVVAGACVERVVTSATKQLFVGRGAGQRVVVRRAVDYDRRGGNVLHRQGKTVADGGVAAVTHGRESCGDRVCRYV